MTTRLILPGREVENAASSETLLNTISVETIRTHVVDTTVRGTDKEQFSALEGAHDSDVVEIEFENGVKQWISVAQLREDLNQTEPQKDSDKREVRVPAALPSRGGGAQRGLIFDLALKGLKVLRISPTTVVAEAGAKAIIAKLEGQLQPGTGLYRFPNPKELVQDDEITSVASLTGDAPWLLFIHGTASSSGGGYWRLAGTDEWNDLVKNYGNRILAYQHRTLSLNPIENAIDLVGKLPDKAKLHLVTHSRGGLVGELLCLPVNSADFDLDILSAPFVSANRPDDAKLLAELVALLKQKKLQVEKIVRVACPARGTILASKRLDLYLSTLLNLISFIPGLKENPIYDFVKATVLELVSLRAEPEELPGIEAQMPESPFIHLLNSSNLISDSSLGVIAGDTEGAGVIGKLKIFATDVFFLEDHDLVVNTDAMYGGLKRAEGKSAYFFEQGAEVNHFNYFGNSSSRSQLQKFLLSDTTPPGFKALKREAPLEMVSALKRDAAVTKDLPVVFLLPGIMGSLLADNTDQIWLKYVRLVLGGMGRLAINTPNILSTGLIASSYQQLVDYLSPNYDVRQFHYDWRRSVEEAGATLRAAISTELTAHKKPIYLLAHSMGGLVSRAMIANDKDNVWRQVCQRGGRLVMLGTPNHGSFIVPQLLAGQEDLLRSLAFWDVHHSLDELIAIIREYPGLLEMLPLEFLEPARWKTIKGLVPPAVNRLREAKQVREKIAKAVDPAHMVYVAGEAALTPCGLDDDTLTFVARAMGDGRVTYELGRLEGVPTWYMEAVHGDMANHAPAFGAIAELLQTGKTDKLSTQPKVFRGEETRQKLPKDKPILFPTEEEVLAAAIGGQVKRGEDKVKHTLKLSVVHTNLRYASYPVAVGHYQGGIIVGAERVIDENLNYRLSRLAQAELYPGAAGTIEVLLAPGSLPQGALVIGLGEMGEITPEKVRFGVSNAALRYALSVIEQNDEAAAGVYRPAKISALLIGTYGTNALSVENSILAIVQGVMQANRALRAQELWNKVRIEVVEFIEIYEDVAIQAINSAVVLARRITQNGNDEERIIVEPNYLKPGEGGQFLRPPTPSTSKWSRIIITSQADGDGSSAGLKNLHFSVQTERARAEESLNATQRGLVDKLIQAASGQSGYDPELGSTLFHLLVPNSLRDQSNDQSNLMMIVDRDAAQYPWELLAERHGKETKPLALKKGMIRQLKTSDYRLNPQPARDLNALVIGDTINNISPLPGAKREAETVNNVLTGSYEVKLLTQEKMPAIINALYAKDYRIIHLAGHGDYDEKNPSKSGMVLSEDTYLTAAELCKLSTVPDLVFINCCHLGRIEAGQEERKVAFGKLAASIAEELIRMGVKAIIAAGWAVDDGAAATFAKVFYDRMLQKATFGDAVKDAREETYNKHQSSNTWGAYQCYGNPEFVLNLGGATSGPTGKFYAPKEYRDKILSLTSAIGNASPDYRANIKKQLTELQSGIRPEWLDGQILSAFGGAWAALGDYAQAIDYYRQAINDKGGKMSLEAVEQLANLEVRHALDLIQAQGGSAKTKRTEADDFIEKSAHRLSSLVGIGRTMERLSLLGSFYKKLAMAGIERHKNLTEAKKYYGEAYEHAQKTKNPDAYYPAGNWAACYILSGGGGGAKGQAMLSERVVVIKNAAAQATDFWRRVAGPEAALIEFLLSAELADKNRQQEIVAQYKKAFDSGSTPKQKDSVYKQFDFMISVLSDKKRDKKNNWLEVVKILTSIKRALL